jgi:hypothetical protein
MASVPRDVGLYGVPDYLSVCTPPHRVPQRLRHVVVGCDHSRTDGDTRPHCLLHRSRTGRGLLVSFLGVVRHGGCGRVGLGEDRGSRHKGRREYVVQF